MVDHKTGAAIVGMTIAGMTIVLLARDGTHVQCGTLSAAAAGHCQPRQREEAIQKDILVIRRTSRIGPAERHLLRPE